MSKSSVNRGVTLIELVTVIVVLGVLSAYVAITNLSVGDVTLPSQAQKLATDLRHAQTLASTWGTSLVVSASVDGNVYGVSCITTTIAAPCNVAPVIDPATGAPFSVTLQKGVTFSAVSNGSLTFNSLGQPNAAASYTLSSGTSTNTVTVEAITGKVTP